MPAKHDNCFGFLRFLFAIIIVIAHLRVVSQIPEFEITKVFSMAVNRTAFFVISGFLIMLSFDHSRDIKHFFTKRAKRIFPAYLTIIFICAIFLVFLSDYSAKDYFTHPMWWKYIAANVSFMNFIQPCLPGVFNSDIFTECSVNGALWTQKVEVGFYLIVPLLAYILRRSKRAWVWLVGIYIFSVLWSNGCDFMEYKTGNSVWRFLEHQLPGCMSYFAAGMLAYQYKDIFFKYKNWLVIPAIIIVVIEKMYGLNWLQPAGNATVLLWCAYSLTWLNSLEWLGDMSYGIYLYHFPILKVLFQLGLFSIINIWIAAGVYILLVIALAAASWHLMEKRIIGRK